MISLILATKGYKKQDINRFLNSIKLSNSTLFEVIVVCQDRKGYLDELISNYKFEIRILYTITGLSRSRNIGIKNAKGNILAFPDDDCVYPENLIEKINLFFEKRKEIDIISFNVFDLSNSYRLPFVKVSKSRELSMKDISFGVSSISIFHRNNKNIFFDEDFGMGAKYNSSEEFDYVLRLMQAKSRLWFSEKYRVLHPDSSGYKSKNIYKRTRRNAVGHGAYFKKNLGDLGLIYIFEHLFLRPFFGFLYYSILFEWKKAISSLILLYGRLKGFLSY